MPNSVYSDKALLNIMSRNVYIMYFAWQLQTFYKMHIQALYIKPELYILQVTIYS